MNHEQQARLGAASEAALVEAVAEFLANAAKENGHSWYWDEWEGERFVGWDEIIDEDMDVCGDWWVKGKDYYREQARAAIAAVHAFNCRQAQSAMHADGYPVEEGGS